MSAILLLNPVYHVVLCTVCDFYVVRRDSEKMNTYLARVFDHLTAHEEGSSFSEREKTILQCRVCVAYKVDRLSKIKLIPIDQVFNESNVAPYQENRTIVEGLGCPIAECRYHAKATSKKGARKKHLRKKHVGASLDLKWQRVVCQEIGENISLCLGPVDGIDHEVQDKTTLLALSLTNTAADAANVPNVQIRPLEALREMSRDDDSYIGRMSRFVKEKVTREY